MALAYLRAAFGERWRDALPEFTARRSELELAAAQYLLETGDNAPLTSSAGRLFDAVASLLGLYDEVRFEAQAAIALEHAARGRSGVPYNIDLGTTGTGDDAELSVSFLPAIRQIADDLSGGAQPAEAAMRFHATVAAACATVATRLASQHGLRTAVLSGGVFQNALLFDLLAGELQRRSFTVLTHRQVPANDGGISLGQVCIAQSIITG
jgi:hydrogenase maturation protein HypF